MPPVPKVPVSSAPKTIASRAPSASPRGGPRSAPPGSPRSGHPRARDPRQRPQSPADVFGGVERPEPVDYANPGIIFTFIIAGISDFLFFFVIAVAIPAVGPFILMGILAVHYTAGAIVLAIMWPHLSTKGLKSLNAAGLEGAAVGMVMNPRMIMIGAWGLPLPSLSIGVIAALIMQSRVVKIIDALLPAIGMAVVGVLAAPETGGASLAVEGAAAAEVGAAAGGGAIAAGAAATETAAAGAGAAEGAVQGARAAGSAGRGAGEAGRAAQGAEDMAKEERLRRALGEQPEIMEGLQEQLLQQTPSPQAVEEEEEEEGEPARGTVRVRDRGNVVDLAARRERLRGGGVVQSSGTNEPSSAEDKKLAA